MLNGNHKNLAKNYLAAVFCPEFISLTRVKGYKKHGSSFRYWGNRDSLPWEELKCIYLIVVKI